jgi:uncharacterized protein (DUF4213/DUF364 family)
MDLLSDLLNGLSDRKVVEVRIGLHWTAVVIEAEGRQRCGLASTFAQSHEHSGEPDVPQAGHLETLSGLELAVLARSARLMLAGIGVAAINALLPPQPDSWFDGNAEVVIAAHGAGKTVALIGRFPFVRRLRPCLGELFVLEHQPGEGDLPADAAPEVLPRADVVAITGTTLINHTLEDLLKLCSPEALVLVLGPSTPLSPTLFNHGIDFLSGSVVTDIQAVLKAVGQGANFRQIHRAGVRLVNMRRPEQRREGQP